MKKRTKSERFIIWIANLLDVKVIFSPQFQNSGQVIEFKKTTLSPRTYRFSKIEMLGLTKENMMRDTKYHIANLIAEDILSDPQNFTETQQTMYMDGYPKKIGIECKIVVIKPEDEGKHNFIDYDQECF
jgi:hypothetical protein